MENSRNPGAARAAGPAGGTQRDRPAGTHGEGGGGLEDRAVVEADVAAGGAKVAVLADPEGARYLPGAFVLALGALRAESQVTDAFRTGDGMGWHEHHEDVFAGCGVPEVELYAIGFSEARQRPEGYMMRLGDFAGEGWQVPDGICPEPYVLTELDDQ